MFRGGPLAEERVIHLLNRRFVCFYYNLGAGGCGYDADAAAFVKKSGSQPLLSIYQPTGELVIALDHGIQKDRLHAVLVRTLTQHAEFNTMTDDEQKTLDAAKEHADDAAAQLAAGELLDQLGRAPEAQFRYSMARKLAGTREAAVATLRFAILARHQQRTRTAALCLDEVATATASDGATDRFDLLDDVALERAHALLDAKKNAEARDLLTAALRTWPASNRTGELRWLAGKACYRLGDKPMANYHWTWVMENLADDRMFMRCYLAVAVEAIPFPNPELDGASMASGVVTHDSADRARAKAHADYERIRKELAQAATEKK
ncbi:MAG: hypothetical protein AB7K09_19115 [Planctomycetota bacterium]